MELQIVESCCVGAGNEPRPFAEAASTLEYTAFFLAGQYVDIDVLVIHEVAFQTVVIASTLLSSFSSFIFIF